MTTATRMNVGEYRDAIDALAYWFNSLQSAATRQEQVNEAKAVKQHARALRAAVCPRAKPRDLERAEWLLDTTASYLIARDLHGEDK